ncbi:hypothetical protein MVEN_00124600 [Mycena venus]|uniref:Uncharacterized protein n=1 Tax=Mycena venus TaxID=2733690 RepID=A0A8H6Z4V8_9AGAR|nr:hypothetical protein MVEN_00124600 [Mycena venus]
MRAQFIIVLSALAAIGAAYPGAKLGRSNSFNGDICNTDSDCPSDYPYCQGRSQSSTPSSPPSVSWNARTTTQSTDASLTAVMGAFLVALSTPRAARGECSSKSLQEVFVPSL